MVLTISYIIKNTAQKKNLSIDDLKIALDKKHTVVSLNKNPYRDLDIEIELNQEMQKLDHWKEIEEYRIDKSNDSNQNKKRKKDTIANKLEDLVENKTRSLSFDESLENNIARNKINNFINKLTWFQKAPFLSWINSIEGKKPGSQTQRKLSLAVLPIILFVIADPETITRIVELGRNDYLQRSITQPLGQQSIKTLQRSFTDTTGSSGVMTSDILIDVISNFIKPVIQAIYRTDCISFENSKSSIKQNNLPRYNDSYPADLFFWLEIRIASNIVNIGKFGKIPVFYVDVDFKNWYKKNLTQEHIIPEQISFLKNIYKDNIPKIVTTNPYLNWQTEEYMRRKGFLKDLV